jgi:hypothetical protein
MVVPQSDFKATPGSIASVRLSKQFPVRTVVLVGLGPKRTPKVEDATPVKLEGVGSSLVKVAWDNKIESAGVIVPCGGDVSGLMRAVLNSLYTDNRYLYAAI